MKVNTNMYNFSLAHLNISLDTIYHLWKDKYLNKHLENPNKLTISVDRNDLAVFNNEEWIAGRGLKPSSAFFSLTKPHSKMQPHKDPYSNEDVIRSGFMYCAWAVNIPLTCDIGSRMTWYRVKPGHITQLSGEALSPYNNLRIPMTTHDNLIEVASACLDRPMLVSTSNWHSVINDTDFPRLIFSIRFLPIISISLAAKFFYNA